MRKKEILLRPLAARPIEKTSEPPRPAQTINNLGDLSVDEANMYLSLSEKQRWCDEKNATANLYYLNPMGKIQQVEPSGWWY